MIYRLSEQLALLEVISLALAMQSAPLSVSARAERRHIVRAIEAAAKCSRHNAYNAYEQLRIYIERARRNDLSYRLRDHQRHSTNFYILEKILPAEGQQPSVTALQVWDHFLDQGEDGIWQLLALRSSSIYGDSFWTVVTLCLRAS